MILGTNLIARSGKSSFLLLFLRLLDPLSSYQDVEIDGIRLHQVNRSILRQRLICVPQGLVLLPGKRTIKENLDPLGLATHEECLAVMETVRLSDFVRKHGGLDMQLSTNDLSTGQQQLFGLGRAVLRCRAGVKTFGSKGGIFLLDELNSSLDVKTDKLTQDIMRTEFLTYTVIMVVHHLQGAVDFCDRVLLFDQGTLIEDSDPRLLGASPNSHFVELLMKQT